MLLQWLCVARLQYIYVEDIRRAVQMTSNLFVPLLDKYSERAHRDVYIYNSYTIFCIQKIGPRMCKTVVYSFQIALVFTTQCHFTT